ncbi:MAG: alpha/beta hydrolase [Alphaproteobacteria bacterium]
MPDGMLHGYPADQLEWQLNPSVSIPNHEELGAVGRQRAAAYRAQARNTHFDISYGSRPREALDLYLPDNPVGAPVEIYIHGGYWRRRSKDDSCYLAEQVAKAGAISAMVDYELCPNVTLDEIVREMRACCAWVYRNIGRYGGDPNRIHLSGNSAGGHLVAMMLATDFPAAAPDLPKNLVKSAVPISGIFDCRPVVDTSLNADIRLDPDMARRNSPLFLPPVARCPVVVAVGGAETDEFRRQSRALIEAWSPHGLPMEYLEVPGANHTTVVTETDARGHPLMEARLRLMGVGG